MRAETRTVTIAREPLDVFEFVARAENLPRWAIHFCRDIRRHDGRWRVLTPQGEMDMDVDASAELGVVDFIWTPAPGVRAVAPTRVVPNGDGAEYLFTLFQPPAMDDRAFDAGLVALEEELSVLKRLVEEGA